MAASIAVFASACGAHRQLDGARDLALSGHAQAAYLSVKAALITLGEGVSGDARFERLRALQMAADLLELDLARPGDAAAYFRRIAMEYGGTEAAFSARMRLGDLLHDKLKDFPAAAGAYLGVVEAFPNHAGADEVQLKAARTFLDAGNHDQAICEAEALLLHYPQSSLGPAAQMVAGHALHLAGKAILAAEALHDVAARWPSSPEAPIALVEAGDCAAEAGEEMLAERSYIEALANHPAPRTVQESLARLRRRVAQTTPQGFARADAFDYRGARRSAN